MYNGLPNLCGRSLLQNGEKLFRLVETTPSVPKRSQSQKILPAIVRSVVKVSAQVENDPLRETYWTETVDISAHSEEGKKLFQSFHIVAVPEGQFERFARLRKQMRESLMSQFEESFGRTVQSDASGRENQLICGSGIGGNASSFFPMISVIKRFSAFLKCSTRVDLTIFNIWASSSESIFRGTS